MPSYDSYAELAKIRTATRMNVALNAVQADLLVGLGNNLNAIGREIAATRQTQREALAIQQALLQQEALQGQLEEFIYQSEKVVAECSDAGCQLPPSTRFFWLHGISDQVKSDGIATPIIRGRDNKQAFEKVMASVSSLAKSLENDPDVREALEWAKQERTRAKAEQKRLQTEQAKAQRERQKKIQQLEVRYSTLQSRTLEKPLITWQDFKEWYSAAITPLIEKYSGPLPDKLVHGIVIVYLGWWLIPLIYGFRSQSRKNANDKELFAKMRKIEEELNRILADESIEGPVTGIEMSSTGDGQ